MTLKCLALTFAVGAALVGSVARGETLKFDDLTTSGAVPAGYNGYSFTNFDSITSADAKSMYGANNGYSHGTVSSPTAIYNAFGAPASISAIDGSMFTLTSFDLTAAWDNGLAVTVDGYADGVLLDSDVFSVGESGPTLETVDFAHVDAVSFFSTGGTAAEGVEGGGEQFVLDNLKLTTKSTPMAVTPEPSSLLLLGTGLTGMVGLVRRRLGVRG